MDITVMLVALLASSVILNVGQAIYIKDLKNKIVELTKLLISKGWFN